MPSRVVRQPNGLWALFSTVVEDFTVYNATEAELLEHMVSSWGVAVAAEKMGRGREDRPLDPGHYRDRFTEALDDMALNHPQRDVESRRRQLSDSQAPVPEDG